MTTRKPMSPNGDNRTRATTPTFAGPGDFCQLFSEQMNSLYLLALLLTIDHDLAERCFASALRDCRRTTGVFKDWAGTWARRAIIQNAIQLLRPSSDVTTYSPQTPAIVVNVTGHEGNTSLASVGGLTAFERFVFVMSVLESYSDHECRILLSCFRHEVAEARTRALQQLGDSAMGVASPAVQARRATAGVSNSAAFMPFRTINRNIDTREFRSTQA